MSGPHTLIADVGQRLDWVPHFNNKGGLELIAPDGHKAYLPADAPPKLVVSVLRSIRRHTPDLDDATFGAAVNGALDLHRANRADAQGIRKAFNLKPTSERPVKPVTHAAADLGTHVTVIEVEPPREAPVLAEAYIDYTPEPAPRKLPGGNSVKAETVTDRPWLANGRGRGKGGAALYESKAVIERTHADGTVTYRCAFAGCSEESDNPRSIASHYPKHNRGQGKTKLNPSVTVESDRRLARIDRLAAELRVAFAAANQGGAPSVLTPEALAEHVIDARIARGEGEHREPDTLHDILQRLATLAHAAQALDPTVELRRDVDELRSEVAEARLAADAAEAKLRAAKETLAALRDLTAEAADA
jgi:hypothetical protein